MSGLAHASWVFAALPTVVIEDAPAGYAARTDAICHGDLYARHLLVDDAGDLAGVIDWGDCHRGDPAVDLSAVYALLPPAGRAAFFSHYPPPDEPTRSVMRLRALGHTLSLIAFAGQLDEPDLLRESLVALGHVMAED